MFSYYPSFRRALDRAGSYTSRFLTLQLVAIGVIVGLYIIGVAQMPFEGDNRYLCGLIAAMAVLGLVAVYSRRWDDVEWIATHIVRVGLIGTVIGLIVAFSAAERVSATDVEAIKGMIGNVIGGMFVALYATLLGLIGNVWLKINIRLLKPKDECAVEFCDPAIGDTKFVAFYDPEPGNEIPDEFSYQGIPFKAGPDGKPYVYNRDIPPGGFEHKTSDQTWYSDHPFAPKA